MLKRTFWDAVAAGLLIAIGGCVFLACENRVVGAVLFSVALLSICYKGYVLFTGKVGYIAWDHSKNAVSALLTGLVGNGIATFLMGWLVRLAMPHLGAVAEAICSAKLTQVPGSTFLRAVLCGVLMFVAVSVYREKKSIAGILFCVPVFILSGFEHSIANFFYFSASGTVTLQSAGYLLIVVLGNAVGGVLLPLLDQLGGRKEDSHV